MEIDILKWDVILDTWNNPVPLLYIKPTLAFAQFSRDNSNKVNINISGTGVYDGNVWGVVDTESENGGELVYEIALQTPWISKPLDGVGSINTVVDMPSYAVSPLIDDDEESKAERAANLKLNLDDTVKDTNMSYMTSIMVVCFLIVTGYMLVHK